MRTTNQQWIKESQRGEKGKTTNYERAVLRARTPFPAAFHHLLYLRSLRSYVLPATQLCLFSHLGFSNFRINVFSFLIPLLLYFIIYYYYYYFLVNVPFFLFFFFWETCILRGQFGKYMIFETQLYEIWEPTFNMESNIVFLHFQLAPFFCIEIALSGLQVSSILESC